MFSARLELELTLEEIVHSIHDDLDEWHPVFDALRNDDGVRSLLVAKRRSLAS